MSEELEIIEKSIVVYTTIDNNKIEIIGEFEGIDLQFKFEPQDEIPEVLPEDCQICFTLINGQLNKSFLQSDSIIKRRPIINITFNNFINEESTERCELYRCALDVETVDSNKIQGVAEDIRYISETVEQFKQRIK